ncbi:MAG: hypothetical protein ASARMPREDX12_000669 [Alectoria sarmentosa]|nr:MAG: hypothetical protein ASARMPREDX12_000669 [Alectoria sarmentosa]
MNISRWARTDWWRSKPSMNELARLHNELYRFDEFAQVIYAYPFGKETVANAIKELIPKNNYEFFLARLQPSDEIVGWVALSFNVKGTEEENKDKYEARLEWTEMCSHILKWWKIDSAGGNSNIWDTIKRASSSLQAEHLPRHFCIINSLVLLPQFQKPGVARVLLEHAIGFWKQRVMVGTEWAMWVQAPAITHNMYKIYGFKEVGEYEVDLGDYGFLPKEERKIFGNYAWKFMVLNGTSGSAIEEPAGAQKVDKGKGKDKSPEKVEEHVTAREVGKGKGKDQTQDDLGLDEGNHSTSEEISQHDAERTRTWEEAEQRLDEIRFRRGAPPGIGEVGRLIKTQRNARRRESDTTGPSKGKGREHRSEDVQHSKDWQSAPGESVVPWPQHNGEATSQLHDNFVPTKSEEDLIEALRVHGVDEEEIELVKALALSLSDRDGGD